MPENFIMERTSTSVKANGMTASIPSDVSMITIFAQNPFISDGDYREDGWIYVNGNPVKKWFKNIERISVWFPILEDLHKLQKRYCVIKQRYQNYVKSIYHAAFAQVEKVGKAHAKITHNYEGDCDPWWLYTSEKYPGQKGISWDWVNTPEKPLNLEIGNAYYKAEQRRAQIGGRVYRFRTVLEYAIREKITGIQGEQGQILQFKIGDRIYWFQKFQYTWKKLAFPEDNVMVVEA
jgi:hypothetical protein